MSDLTVLHILYLLWSIKNCNEAAFSSYLNDKRTALPLTKQRNRQRNHANSKYSDLIETYLKRRKTAWDTLPYKQNAKRRNLISPKNTSETRFNIGNNVSFDCFRHT